MKINLNQTIKEMDGRDAVIEGKPYYLSIMLSQAALTPQPEDDKVSKIEGFELFLKIKNAGKEIELTTDEVVMLKKRLYNLYGGSALVIGQLEYLMEGKPNPLD